MCIMAIIGIISILFLLVGHSEKDTRIALRKKKIEEKIHISLPDNSIIKKYSPTKNGFYAKVLILEEDIEDIKKQLGSYINEVTPEQIPHYGTYTHFYDLNQKVNNIVNMYTRVVGAETSSDPWSREIWAFITKEANEDYILYIAY